MEHRERRLAVTVEGRRLRRGDVHEGAAAAGLLRPCRERQEHGREEHGRK